MSLSVEPRNTEEAIEKLLLEQAKLRKENQDLMIAKVWTLICIYGNSLILTPSV